MKHTLLALLLIVVPVFAGKRITSESVDLKTNKVTARTILLDVDRLKVDSPDSAVMFLSQGGSRMVMLDKKSNTYRVMDKAAMDAMGQQLSGMTAQMEAAMKGMPPEAKAQMEAMMKGKMGGKQVATPTGAVYSSKGAGNVNGFKCTNYDGVENGVKTKEICAATMADLRLSQADFAVMEKMREYMSGMMNSLRSSPMGGMMGDVSLTHPGVNGFPVQTVDIENGKPVTRDQVKSVTEATFTDADFSTGTATEVAMPGMGAAKGKALKGKAK